MDPFSLLWQSILFSIMTSYEMAIKVTDEVMFTFEDYEVYVKIVKVRNFHKDPDQILCWDLAG